MRLNLVVKDAGRESALRGCALVDLRFGQKRKCSPLELATDRIAVCVRPIGLHTPSTGPDA